MMKYFALKPHGTNEYARASRAAMLTYAAAIAEENPELSRQLTKWAAKETPEQKPKDVRWDR